MIKPSKPSGRKLLASTMVAVATLTLAACGGADDAADDDAGAQDDTEVASLGTVADATAESDAPSGDGEEPTEAEMQEAALEFAKCMREHGIDMPDPQFDTDGRGVAIQVGGPGASIDPEEMEAANEACEPIMEEIRSQFEPPDPEQLEEMKAQALEFAECMREHGVDMPDPQFGENGQMTVAVGGGRLGEEGSGPDPIDAEKFEEASEACGGPGGGMVAINADVEGDAGDGEAPSMGNSVGFDAGVGEE